MPDTVRHKPDILLSYICLFLAAGYGLSFAFVALASAAYPFNIEWMEGHSIEIIQRIRDGLPIYTKPSLEYIPYLYTPLYFYLSALVSFFTGVDFLPARIVSILATFGSSLLLYLWVRKEGGNRSTAMIAAGLFLGTYSLSARWFDVARIDSLYLFLMVAGLYVFHFYKTSRSAYVAGILFAASFLTKQSALIALFPAFLAALWLDRDRAISAALAAFMLSAVICAVFEWQSGGWFWFFIYDIPAAHGNDWRMLSRFWTQDIKEVAFVTIASMLTAWLLWKQDKKKWLWFCACLIGFIGSAYASRLHSFGWMNVLMPAHFMLALGAGLLCARTEALPPRLRLIAPLLVIAQFVSMHYNPLAYIPSKEAEARGREFLQEIVNIPGDILFVETQYIQTKIGKKNFSFGMAGFDITRADLGQKNHIKEAFIADMRAAIESQKFSAVVTGNFLKLRELHGNYEFERSIDNPQEFVTGAVRTPKASILRPVQK